SASTARTSTLPPAPAGRASSWSRTPASAASCTASSTGTTASSTSQGGSGSSSWIYPALLSGLPRTELKSSQLDSTPRMSGKVGEQDTERRVLPSPGG